MVYFAGLYLCTFPSFYVIQYGQKILIRCLNRTMDLGIGILKNCKIQNPLKIIAITSIFRKIQNPMKF